MLFSKPLVRLAPDMKHLMHILTHQLQCTQQQAYGLFPVATVAKLLVSYGLFDAKRYQHKTFTLVLAGAEVEAVHEGAWFRGLNLLLSAPDTHFDIHLVGPEILSDSMKDLAQHSPIFSDPSALPEGNVTISCYAVPLSAFITRYVKSQGELTGIDAVIMLHPGFEKHAEEWGEDAGLSQVLSFDIPVMGTSYGITEFDTDKLFAKSQGFDLTLPLINPLREHFGRDVMMSNLTAFGGTLWKLEAGESDPFVLDEFNLDEHPFQEVDAPVADDDLKHFRLGDPLPAGALLNEQARHHPSTDDFEVLRVLKSLDIQYDSDIEQAYPDIVAPAFFMEGINVVRRHLSGLDDAKAAEIAELNAHNDYITADYARRYGLNDAAYLELMSLLLQSLMPALDVSEPFSTLRRSVLADERTNSFKQGGAFQTLGYLTLTSMAEKVLEGPVTITPSGRLMATLAGVFSGAEELGLTKSEILHGVIDAVSGTLIPKHGSE